MAPLDLAAEGPVRTDEVGLADDLVERARPEAGGEGDARADPRIIRPQVASPYRGGRWG